MIKSLISKLAVLALIFLWILGAGFTKTQDNGISVEEYFKKVQAKDSAVFVYFSADWCVPCVKLKPVITELEKENPTVKVIKLDVDENPQIALHLEINTLPLFFIYKHGKQVWSNNTYMEKKVCKINSPVTVKYSYDRTQRSSMTNIIVQLLLQTELCYIKTRSYANLSATRYHPPQTSYSFQKK